MAGTERASVVTTAKRPATRLAAWKAASPMPTTGAPASARAASRPVSSKQAMTCALTPCASPFAISARRPGDGERVIVEAFDALGTDRRVHGHDARAGRGRPLGGAP